MVLPPGFALLAFFATAEVGALPIRPAAEPL